MAASHRIEIHKSLGGEEWCNTYLMECVTMAEAATFAALLTTFEQHLHRDNVHFDYAIASTLTVGDRVFRHIPINLFGIQTLAGASYMPLWNVLRVDFQTADSDPCRKYYRMPVLESAQTSGVFESAEVTNFNSVIATYFFGTVMADNLYSPKGHLVVSGSAHPQLQMRQLHRKRRHKVLESL